MNLKIFRCRDVKLPAKANKSDAGFDMFIPSFDEAFIKDFEKKNPVYVGRISRDRSIMIHPRQTVMIPSGLKCFIEEGYAMILFNKSGISTKHQLHRVAEVVDSGYSGEIHLCMYNASDEEVSIHENTKIVQFIVQEIHQVDIGEVSENEIIELNQTISTRSSGGFGSTGVV